MPLMRETFDAGSGAMDKVQTRSHPVQLVILILVVLNLIGTAFLLFRVRTSSGPALTPSSPDALPRGLQSQEERMALFERVKKAINSASTDEMLAILDPIARMELSKDQLGKQMKYVRDLTGDILEGAYSHYEATSTSQGTRTYRLYYQIRTERAKAVMIITVGQQDDESYRLLGYQIGEIR